MLICFTFLLSFLEDKTHDDISNILQQWKSNNCVPPSNSNSHQHLQQHTQEQGKLFKRPTIKVIKKD